MQRERSSSPYCSVGCRSRCTGESYCYGWYILLIDISVIGLLDNLIMYMQMEDEDIRLAAAHAIEFLSTNIKIKKQLADNDALIKIMVFCIIWL